MRFILIFLLLLTTAPCSRAQTLEESYARVQGLLGRCEYDKAFDEAKSAYELADRELPANDERGLVVAIALADAARLSGRGAIALEQSQRVLGAMQLTTKDPILLAQAKLRRGRAFAAAGRYVEASEDVLAAAEQLAPVNGAPSLSALEALSVARQIEGQVGNVDLAGKLARRAIEMAKVLETDSGPLTADALIKFADIERRALAFKTAESALDDADQILARKPADPTSVVVAQLYRARLEADRGDLDGALKRLEQLQPKLSAASSCERFLDVDALELRAVIHLHARRLVEGRAALNNALDRIVSLNAKNNPRYAELLHETAIAEAFANNKAQSEILFDQARLAFAQIYGKGSLFEALTISEHAVLLARSGDGAAALPLAQEAVTMTSSLSPRQPLYDAYARASLGFAQKASGDFAAARVSFNAALEGMRKVRGQDSFDLPPGLVASAEMAIAQHDPHQAANLLNEAIRIQLANGSTTVLQAATSESLLAQALNDAGDSKSARAASQRALAIISDRREIGAQARGPQAVEEVRMARALVERDLELTLSGGGGAPISNAETVNRALLAIQLGNLTRADLAVSQVSARLAKGDTPLGRLVAKRQSALEAVSVLETRFQNAALNPSGDGASAAKINATLAEARKNLASIESQLERDFPQFRELTAPVPLSVSQVAESLSADEMLLALFVGDRATYAVAVSKTSALAKKIDISTVDVEKLVKRIRYDVDCNQWAHCEKLPPIFDVDAGFALYEAIIHPFEALTPTETGTLLYVADGPLASLPLEVLVTEKIPALTKLSQHKSVPWLVKRFAVAVVPSVTALRSLRATAGQSRAVMPFAGVGNPALATPGARSNRNRDLAREGLNAASNGQVNPDVVREIASLPETEGELRAMMKTFGAKESDLWLGGRATEKAIMQAPLSSYRVLVFATHGVLPLGLSGLNEPGLILTPPPTTSAEEDGFLSASEIASGLSLNADWVILAACSTAGADGAPHAEALSGLARAFFYAGARSVYVSHWDVPSDATTMLTTSMVNFAADGKRNRAQAARDAQLSLMNSAEVGDLYGHPYYWAAFSLVGAN